MTQPRVSVVIPAFDAAEHLPRSIGSLARVDFPPERLQVIVVDDGSRDGTAQRARDLLAGLKCDTQVLSIPNGGPAHARNAGLGAAAGECVQFLDADDELGEGKIAAQAGVLALDPACAVAYSRWRVVSPEGREIERDPDLGQDPMSCSIGTIPSCRSAPASSARSGCAAWAVSTTRSGSSKTWSSSFG